MNNNSNFLLKARKILWPIERGELSIFIPMSTMMFCILFNFSALRSIKDGLVVPNIGAEVISFLKFWVVLPSAILFTLIYTKLSNILRIEQIFYIIVSFFLFVLFCFSFLIYPNESYFHPSQENVDFYVNLYPHFQWQIRILGKWSYVLVYVVGELWSAIVITLMFWQLANTNVTTNQAKRLYPFFAVIGNFGLVFSGMMMIFATKEELPGYLLLILGEGVTSSSTATLKMTSIAIIFFGIIAMLLYRYIAVYVFQDNCHISVNSSKLSISESLRLVVRSRYLWKILIIVVSYGLAINIVEGPWKDKVRELHPSTVEYISFMGRFNIWMGIACVVFTIFGSNILRFGSWLMAALVTPLIMGLTGGMFFVFVVFAHKFKEFEFVLIDPIFAAVIFGAVQNIMSKSTKYSLFDATKEMTYIPLSLELKTKGKAAVDVIGTKLGKSMGALMQSLMFSLFPLASFEVISPYLMVVFLIIISIWVVAVKSLNEEYSAISNENA